jgi:hypothetical protein
MVVLNNKEMEKDKEIEYYDAVKDVATSKWTLLKIVFVMI